LRVSSFVEPSSKIIISIRAPVCARAEPMLSVNSLSDWLKTVNKIVIDDFLISQSFIIGGGGGKYPKPILSLK
jgi:hypothetical protein